MRRFAPELSSSRYAGRKIATRYVKHVLRRRNRAIAPDGWISSSCWRGANSALRPFPAVLIIAGRSNGHHRGRGTRTLVLALAAFPAFPAMTMTMTMTVPAFTATALSGRKARCCNGE